MLGIDHRAARCAWTAALVVLVLYLVYMVRQTLFVFVLALLFAYLLSPLVELLDRFLPASRTRTPALALAYAIFVGLVVFLGIQIGSRVVEQANTLTRSFPDMITKWQQPIPAATPTINSMKEQILEKVRAEVAVRAPDIISTASRAGLKVITVAGDLIYVVIIPILGFFFLKDGRVMRQHILDIVEAGPRRALLDDVMADINILLAHYMRALVLLSVAAFAAYGVFFSIMGVPYGVLLAAVAGLLEFIPMIGPLSASVSIVVVAAVTGGHVPTVLIFLLAYRLFQDYILSPHLMRHGVELHPLLVLFGVFAGAEVAGIAGTFLSVPVLALARVVYLRFRKARLGVLGPSQVVTL